MGYSNSLAIQRRRVIMVMEAGRKVSLIMPILPWDIQADNNVAFMTGSQHCFSFPPEEARGTIQLPPRHYIWFYYLRGIIVKHGSQHQVDGLAGRLIGETPRPIITWAQQTCNLGQKAQCNLTKPPFSFSSLFSFKVHG